MCARKLRIMFIVRLDLEIEIKALNDNRGLAKTNHNTSRERSYIFPFVSKEMGRGITINTLNDILQMNTKTNTYHTLT